MTSIWVVSLVMSAKKGKVVRPIYIVKYSIYTYNISIQTNMYMYTLASLISALYWTPQKDTGHRSVSTSQAASDRVRVGPNHDNVSFKAKTVIHSFNIRTIDGKRSLVRPYVVPFALPKMMNLWTINYRRNNMHTSIH